MRGLNPIRRELSPCNQLGYSHVQSRKLSTMLKKHAQTVLLHQDLPLEAAAEKKVLGFCQDSSTNHNDFCLGLPASFAQITQQL